VGRKQHPLEIHGMDTILGEGISVEDVSSKDLLVYILLELKVMNSHLSEITDMEIEKGEIDNDY